jgi:hypothetical protein
MLQRCPNAALRWSGQPARHVEDELNGIGVAQVDAGSLMTPTSDRRQEAITASDLPQDLRSAKRRRQFFDGVHTTVIDCCESPGAC